MEVKEFIASLEKENEEFYASQPGWAKSYWPEKLTKEAAILSLRTRFWNEYLGAEAIARFMLRLDDQHLKMMVGRQVGDEAKHAFYVKKRLKEMGGSVESPLPEQIEYTKVLDSFQYPEEFFAAQQFTVETQSIKRNLQAEGTLDKETVDMFKKHVNNDEVFHSRLGRLGLAYYCVDTSAQERARRATALIREKHMAISLANHKALKEMGLLDVA